MPLVKIPDLASPKQLRAGWATLAAAQAAYGWTKYVYADENAWYYHDGGGNWASLRFKNKNQAVLVGHDHEYSDTYFAEAAEYFQEEETDLLKDAPEWWANYTDPLPFGDWIGFVYGWNGDIWERAEYEENDGFDALELLTEISQNSLSESIAIFFKKPDPEKLNALIKADGKFTPEMLEAVIPLDVEAGITAAQKFLLADI